MFTELTDTNKAGIYSVLVLFMATGAALSIRFLDLTANLGMWILWSCTPTVAALLMLLVVTREGYSWEGWKVLCLHRLGLSVWWIAFGLTLIITVALCSTRRSWPPVSSMATSGSTLVVCGLPPSHMRYITPRGAPWERSPRPSTVARRRQCRSRGYAVENSRSSV
jgi:hypothetical protein